MDKFEITMTDRHQIHAALSGHSKDEFIELGHAQRAIPEQAMLAIAQHHRGLLQFVTEHVGDLIHRMNDENTFDSAGWGYVKDKVDKSLKCLTSDYGFSKENDEQIRGNAAYQKIPLASYRKKLGTLLQAYADAHRTLPVFNDAQKTAQEASVALGEQRWYDAVAALKKLKSHLNSSIKWKAYAHEGLNEVMAHSVVALVKTAAVIDWNKIGKPFYHATSSTQAGESILSSGEIIAPSTVGNGYLAPVKGMTYVSSSLKNAAIYSLGGVMMGHDYDWTSTGSSKFHGQYGYIFEVEHASMSDAQPDEDSVGELVAKGLGEGGKVGGRFPGDGKGDAPWWLMDMAKRFVAPSRLGRAIGGEYAYYASIGKQLLKRMSDRQKAQLIEEYGTHVANRGNLKIKKAWRVDKSQAKLIEQDGSNILTIAEEIPVPNLHTANCQFDISIVANDGLSTSENSSSEFIKQWDKCYPVAGKEVDGRIVRQDIPNLDSISSSFYSYHVLPGVREVSMSDFRLTGKHYSVQGDRRIGELAGQIKQSGEINPLIVAIDENGPYILEGATRAESLFRLGAKAFPAIVVIDTTDGNQDDSFPVNIKTAQAQFSGDARIDNLFYGEEKPETVKNLVSWLKQDPNRFVRLYHGTAAKHNVMVEGLLPTSGSRRNSLHSGSGYVYLSVFPTSAEDFARMAYPGKDIVVYAVDISIRRLKPDKDQLRNKRYWGGEKYQDIGNSLAESLIYGHGARVEGKINPMQISVFKTINTATPNQTSPIEQEESFKINILDKTSSKKQEFWDWFNGSKIVDKTGKPLVAYHGTRSSFDDFSETSKQSNPYLFNDNQLGFFFDVNPGGKSDFGSWSGAAGFAGVYQKDGETSAPEGSRTIPVVLNIKNPKIYGYTEYIDAIEKAGGGQKLKEELKNQGFDGVVRNLIDSNDPQYIVAFGPEQIRTAIGVLHNADTLENTKNNFKIIIASSDVEYLNAAARGDEEACQQMVDAAAKAAGYDVGPVYHGSGSADIVVFNPSMAGKVQRSDWGGGVYFTPSQWMADGYRIDAVKNSDPEYQRLWNEFESKAKEMGTTPMGMAIDLGWGSKAYKELEVYHDKFIQRGNELNKAQDKGGIYPVYLRMKHPMIYKAESITDPFLAQHAMEKGYDSLVIVNENPRQGQSIEQYADEIVIFDANQIKSAAAITRDDQGNIVPLSQRFNSASSDIRFEKTIPVVTMASSQMNHPTANEHAAIKAYHGSGTDIQQFSYDFTGIGNDQIGSGFYFTTDKNEARGYTSRRYEDQPKPGGEDSPTIHEVELDIRNPLDADAVGTIPPSKVRRLLEMSPVFDNVLSNWGDVEFEGRSKVVANAVAVYSQTARNNVICRALFPIANDFYQGHVKEFNDAVTTILGYDGVVQDYGNKKHYVAFRPDQIKIVGREKVSLASLNFLSNQKSVVADMQTNLLDQLNQSHFEFDIDINSPKIIKYEDLIGLRHELAEAANAIVNAWQQDSDGVDEIYDRGGICDSISNAMGDILASHGYDFIEGGQEGDDHSFLIVYDESNAFVVDINPAVYETGSGYAWRKKDGAHIADEDVEIVKSMLEPEDVKNLKTATNKVDQQKIDINPIPTNFAINDNDDANRIDNHANAVIKQIVDEVGEPEWASHFSPGDEVLERVVWGVKIGQDIATNSLSAVDILGDKSIRALHVTGDAGYWIDLLSDEYDRDKQEAQIIEIKTLPTDRVVDDVQYAIDPDGGMKADSAILLTTRQVLHYGDDWWFKGKPVKAGYVQQEFPFMMDFKPPVNVGELPLGFSNDARNFGLADYIDDSDETGMWHVTTAKDKVLAEGLKSRRQTGLKGLGGGVGDQSPDKVSVTFSYAQASAIAERLETAALCATNQISLSDVIDQFSVSDDSPYFVAQSLQAPSQTWEDWDAFDEWVNQEYAGQAYRLLQDLDDNARDTETEWQYGQRVGLTSEESEMAKINPDQIAILDVAIRLNADVEHIADEAEIRVHPEDVWVISQERTASDNTKIDERDLNAIASILGIAYNGSIKTKTHHVELFTDTRPESPSHGFTFATDAEPTLEEVASGLKRKLHEVETSKREKNSHIKLPIVVASSDEWPVVAVIIAAGRAFEGRTHAEALQKAKNAGFVEDGDNGTLVDRNGKVMNYDGSIDLFLTNKGRIIDRFEAHNLGKATGAEDIPEEQRDDVETIVKRHTALGVESRVSERNGNTISLDHLRVEKGSRNAGLGSSFMRDLCEYADRRGKSIELSLGAKAPGETTSKGRLIRFYSRFGFVRNFGRTIDYRRSCQMYRLPRQPNPENKKTNARKNAGCRKKAGSSNVFNGWAKKNGKLCGWRGKGSSVGIGSEGNGLYVAKTKETASIFGEPVMVCFNPPKSSLLVNDEPFYLLNEMEEMMREENESDSEWLRLNKRAVRAANVTDSDWRPQDVAAKLTELISRSGYDCVYVVSSPDEWVVLLKPDHAKYATGNFPILMASTTDVNIDDQMKDIESWLGSSVVKNPVWHGSASEPFEIFDPSKRGTGVGDPNETAFFFASNRDEAEWYREQAVEASDEESEGHVGAYYIKLENPYLAQDEDFINTSMADVIRKATELGHDGVAYQDRNAMIYAVLESNQIRKAPMNSDDTYASCGSGAKDMSKIATSSFHRCPKAWFGSSKVVDDNGNPLVVYHGSRNPMVEQFSHSLMGTGIVSGMGPKPNYGAFFFTSDPENASFFADFKEVPERLSEDLVTSYGNDEEWFYSADDEEGNSILNGGSFASSELAEKAGIAHVKRYNKAQEKQEDMFVRGYYLKIENPLEVTSQEMRDNRWSPSNLVPIAKDAGKDGIIIRDFVDGSTVSDIYMVFNPSQISRAGGVPKMASSKSMNQEQLSSMEFNAVQGGSISPNDAFKWRELMTDDHEASGHETLADLAAEDDPWRLENALGKGWESSFNGLPASLHLKNSIMQGKKIRVFRATEYGGILPGSYVTESLGYAKMHGETQLEGKTWKIHTIDVYPNELVSLGDPHEFIYVPSNPQAALGRLTKGRTISRQASSINNEMVKVVKALWSSSDIYDKINEAKTSDTMAGVKLGEYEGVSIELVNGNHVKKEAYMDFVEGGNDMVYGKTDGERAQFMPDKTVWIDAHLDRQSMQYVAIHELVERQYMSENDMGYDEAHGVANQYEKTLRENDMFGEGGFDIVVTGKLNRDTGVDDSPASGHLDTQLFPDCSGTKFDRDVVVKTRKRRQTKKAQTETWKPVAMRMMQRDEKNFANWMKDLGEERGKFDLDYCRDFLNEKYCIEIRDDGLVEINWRVDDDVERIVDSEKIVVFHATSSKLLPSIRKNGLLSGESDVNRLGSESAGVYVSLRSGGIPMEMYARSAVAKHGGEPVVLEISTTLSSLSPDPDDADIDSGSYQYVLSRVAPADILNIGRTKTAQIDSERDIDGELLDEIKFVPVKSSVINAVAYFEPSGWLEFTMNNQKVYTFLGVARNEFESFLAADSKGRWFADFVKRYRASRQTSKQAFGLRPFGKTAGTINGLPTSLTEDEMVDFLVRFLGYDPKYSRTGKGSSHRTYTHPKHAFPPATAAFGAGGKLDLYNFGGENMLKEIGLTAHIFRTYYRNRKRWLKRAETVGCERAFRELMQSMGKEQSEKQEENKQPITVDFNPDAVNRERLDLIMRKVPYLNKQFNDMKGHFDVDDLYQMVHDIVKFDPRLIALYESPNLGTMTAESAETLIKTASTTWGRAGSGTLFYCPDDQTVLLLKRSALVEDPGLWGIPGGAVKGSEGFMDDEDREDVSYGEEELQNSAQAETEEEMGCSPEGAPTGSVTLSFGNFRYTTFRIDVNSEQKQNINSSISLNWESDEYQWFPLNRLPASIHPGVKEAMEKLIGNSK